jgi:hypothetical protein
MRLVESGAEVCGERRRIRGTVRFDDGSREEYWFDLPAGDPDAEPGNPWAIALLPLAMSRAESLEIPLPVDPILLRNLELLQGIWRAWYPTLLSVVDLGAPEESPGSTGSGVVSCFSGGVDSFFTLIRNHRRFPAGHARRITALLLVHGADIPVDDGETYAKLRQRYALVAAEFGVDLIDAQTNFRSGSLGKLSWPDLTHAACLAACAASLGGEAGCLLIPSGAPYRSVLRPWGSTPLTDPLFSSSRLRVEHDGAQLSRPEKIEYLSTDSVVRAQLRVCWRSGTDQNCGRCAKCFRTMAVLDAIGQLEAFTAFPRDTYSNAMLAKVYCGSPSEYLQLRLVHGLALSRGREDLARAVNRAIGRSDAIHARRAVVGFLEGGFSVRVLGPLLERFALSSSIFD